MKETELHSQLDRVGRQRQPAFEHRVCLLEAPNAGKLAAMFEKRRRKRWPPRRGPAQLIECLVAASGRSERRGKQGFDRGIAAAACRPFQRCDRLGGAVLHQQRLTENLRRAGVAAVRLQHVSGNALGLVGTLHPQRQGRAFERLIDGVRPSGAGRKWRALRHRPRR